MNLDCKTKLFCVDKPGVVVTFSETYLTVTCYQWLCDLYVEKKYSCTARVGLCAYRERLVVIGEKSVIMCQDRIDLMHVAEGHCLFRCLLLICY